MSWRLILIATLMSLLSSVVGAAETFEPVPSTLLGFGKGATKSEVLAAMGEPEDVSGDRSSTSYMFVLWNVGTVLFTFNVGDQRIQQILLSGHWLDYPKREVPPEQAGRLALVEDDLQWFGQSHAQLEPRFGPSIESNVRSAAQLCLEYRMMDGSHFCFQQMDPNIGVDALQLLFEYDNIPPEYIEPVPMPVVGRERIQDRTSCFGVAINMPMDAVRAVHGSPVREIVDGAHATSWFFTGEKSQFEIRAEFRQDPRIDIRASEPPPGFLLHALTIRIPNLKTAEEFKAPVRSLKFLGWDDPLLSDLGATRGALRARYGDPDSYLSDSWRYVINGSYRPDVIQFKFDGDGEQALCIAITLMS